jgi:hypothetical protein
VNEVAIYLAQAAQTNAREAKVQGKLFYGMESGTGLLVGWTDIAAYYENESNE